MTRGSLVDKLGHDVLIALERNAAHISIQQFPKNALEPAHVGPGRNHKFVEPIATSHLCLQPLRGNSDSLPP